MTPAAYALLLPLVMGPPAQRPAFETSPHALGPVGLAGIVVGAAGVGLTGAGVVRLVQGEARAPSSTDLERIAVTDSRPQGRAFLGVGLGVTALGVTALVLDLSILRKQRSRRAAIAPLLGPTTAGLVIRGRFEVRTWH